MAFLVGQGASVQNPFQSADLRDLPWWQGVALYDDKNRSFEALAQELESAFRKAVNDGALKRFSNEYDRIARLMLEQMPNEPLLPAIVDHAHSRLITIYCYLRQRRNAPSKFLAGNSSVIKWNIGQDILARPIEQANRMQQVGLTHQDFDLKSSPDLRRWIFENYWPLVSKFSGIAALPLTCAHIRCLNHDKDAGEYQDRFRFHHFGNHHFDQDVYSLPLIIYLSEVSDSCGPFEYLAASDKYSNNFVLKAFHQALNHDCGISSLEEKNFPVIARLPSIFRGGDVLGNLYPQAEFEKAGPVTVNGGIGTAIMFDGFNVIHAGGFPSAGIRKSLFVNFRFPVAKIIREVKSLFLMKRISYKQKVTT